MEDEKKTSCKQDILPEYKKQATLKTFECKLWGNTEAEYA